MVVAAFSVMDKTSRVKFFEETFLVANVSPKVVLGMLFLILSSANVNFLGRKLWWRTYTTAKTLPTTKHIELVGKKEFAAAALNLENETFIIQVMSLSSDTSPNSSPLELNVHLSHRSQVSSLIGNEVPTKVSAKYLDFTDVFSPDLASELPKQTEINNHAIELVDS